jgi:hypothetical protein
MTQLPTISYENYETALQWLDEEKHGLVKPDPLIKDCCQIVIFQFENGVPVDV